MFLRCKIKNLISEKLRSLVFVVGMFSAQFGYTQINVVASPDHLKIDGIDTLGNFFLNVTGGTSPYTYTWAPGSLSSKDYTNATIGAYTLNVVDNASNTATYKYNMGYKSTWTNFYNCISRNDSLIPNSTGGVNRSAISKNVLRPNTDGWMEMVYYPEFDLNVIGLVDTAMAANQGNWYDYDLAVHVSSSALYATEGVNWYYLGPISYGDVVRIERTSNVFYVRHNSTVTFTLGGINHNMQVKGLFGSGGLINVGTSFSDTTKLYPLKAEANLDHIRTDDIDSLGNIYLSISRGLAPYTVNWSPNNVSAQNNLSIPKGSYTATVIDSNNDTLIYNCSLGYKMDWTNFYGSISRNDSLMSNSSSGYTNRSAVSNNILRPDTDGWVEMIIKPVNVPFVMGFLDSMIVANQGDHNDIDVGIHVTYGNDFYIWTGVSWSYVGVVDEGDRIRFERTSNVFYIKLNDSLVHTQSGINKSLKVKGLIYYSALVNVGTSFADSTSNYPLKIMASVDHIRISCEPSLGNIRLGISGGASPYEYTWIPDSSYSKNKSNAAYNLYTLKVKDYNGDSLIYSYNLGYKANWMKFYGSAFRNDSLFSDGSISGNNTAISTNELMAYKDGWFEFVAEEYSDQYLIGFLDSVSPYNYNTHYDYDFAVYETSGSYLYAYSSGYFTYLDVLNKGDVVKVDRVGSTFSVKINGATMYSNTALPQKKLRIKGLIITTPLVNIGCSFKLDAFINKEPIDSLNSPFSGASTVVPFGGVNPYNVTWSYNDGIVANPRDGLSQGTYTVVLTDSTNADLLKKVINIGVKPHWGLKKNINVNLDSTWTNRSDSLGIAVSDYVVEKNEHTWFEGRITNLTHDVCFGFIGVEDTISGVNSLVMAQKIDSVYSLIDRAVNGTLPVSGSDSVLAISSCYDTLFFARMYNGRMKLILPGLSYIKSYSYGVNDMIKVGRNSVGNVFVARNDSILFTNSVSIGGVRLFGTLVDVSTTQLKDKSIFVKQLPVAIIKPTNNNYNVLKRQLDGSYYTTINNKLYFTIDGDYNLMGLDYKVYNYKRSVMTGITLNQSTSLVNGDNRYYLGISSLAFGYYVLEVTNQKKEKRLLRFSKAMCYQCN